MNRIAIFLLIVCSSLAAEQTGSADLEHKTITSFAVSGVPAIRALLQLARSENIPLGIVADDRRLCVTEITYSAKNVAAPMIIQGIIGQVPGYKWRPAAGFSIVVISPDQPRLVTRQFLDLVDDHFGPIRGNPQTLLTALWVHVRYLLHPEQGTAVSILGSSDDRTFALETRNETVQQVLNRIAVVSRGTWVLRPLPDALQKVGAEVPFTIFSNAGNSAPEQGDLCNPVLEDSRE